MKNWKKMIVTAAAFASMALFAGCTSASAVSADEAKDLVRQTVGDPSAVVVELESDRDDGVYELEVIVDGVGYEYEVDSRTGQLREVERDNDIPATRPAETKPVETKPAETKPAENKSERISAEKALSIAMSHAGVSDIRDRDVEWDDGRWEVSFESGAYDYDYDISADGTVLHWEKEHDHDDHGHDHDD